MALEKEHVEHISKLARLMLSPEECEVYAKELTSILGYIDCLSELDTEGVLPTSQVTGLTNVLEEDEIRTDWCKKEELLATTNLPVKDDQIQVKAVME